MSEKELDSSIYSYIEENKKYNQQIIWDMAIGLQEVDDLKPSKYFINLLEENINGNMTIDEVKESLKEYYVKKKTIMKSIIMN